MFISKTKERGYSLLDAIRRELDPTHKGGSFERELSDEMRKRANGGKAGDHGGIILPTADLLREAGIKLQERALGKSTGGGSLVATDNLIGDFIPALVARTVLGKAGITHLDNLVGDITIPTVTDGLTAAWITTEHGDASQVSPNFTQKSATPHSVAAYCDITRKLLVQTSNAAERLVIEMIQDAIGRAIEAAAFSGTGANGEPLGLLNTTGVQTVTMTANAPTKSALVEFVTKLATANANADAARWIVSPGVAGLLSRTLDIQTVADGEGATVGGVTSGKYLLDGGKIDGRDAFTSNLSGTHLAWLADWSDLVLCTWGAGTEITVDPYSLSMKGGARIVAFHDVDLVVRHPASFVKGVVTADAN